jgi:hypothetical protein
MKGYWNNDSLLFVGKNGPTYGFVNTLNNYKKNYPNKDYMGQLNFTLLEVKPLSKQLWMVLGKWELTRTAGNVSGHYTLLFKKINGAFGSLSWIIVVSRVWLKELTLYLLKNFLYDINYSRHHFVGCRWFYE